MLDMSVFRPLCPLGLTTCVHNSVGSKDDSLQRALHVQGQLRWPGTEHVASEAQGIFCNPNVLKRPFAQAPRMPFILEVLGEVLTWILPKSLCSREGLRPPELSSFATVGSGKHAQGVLKRQCSG